MSWETLVLALTCVIVWNVQVKMFAVGVDECVAGLKSCPENSMCNDMDVNTNETATCTCKTGYTGNQTFCADIDECNTERICPGEGSQCENNQGSYLCLCKPNYMTLPNRTCVDVDECTKEQHDCHKDADCINFGGGFNCTCKSGFSGDGKTSCEDINECNATHECHSNATCENTPGSYECVCKVERGISCQDTHDKNTDDDDHNDTVIILLSITIVLLVLCLIALAIAIFRVYSNE